MTRPVIKCECCVSSKEDIRFAADIVDAVGRYSKIQDIVAIIITPPEKRISRNLSSRK